MLYGLEDIPFGQIAPQTTLERDAVEAIKLAKAGTAAVVVLQAIAAFSAFGMVLITWKNYLDKKKKRRTRPSRRYARLKTTTRYRYNRGRSRR